MIDPHPPDGAAPSPSPPRSPSEHTALLEAPRRSDTPVVGPQSTPRDARHARRAHHENTTLAPQSPSRKRRRCVPSDAICPLSLELIPVGHAKRVRVGSRVRVYDVKYLLAAVEADEEGRDPCTRIPFSPHQLASIRKSASSVGVRVASPAVLRFRHDMRKRHSHLSALLLYHGWSDLEASLAASVSDIEQWCDTVWFSDLLRCEIAERWFASEERHVASAIQRRMQLSELLRSPLPAAHSPHQRLAGEDESAIVEPLLQPPDAFAESVQQLDLADHPEAGPLFAIPDLGSSSRGGGSPALFSIR